MKKHVKIYRDRFPEFIDYFPCEVCGDVATDIHHIKYKSRGGKDEIDNLIGLCRSCHNKAHDEIIRNLILKQL